MNQDLDTLLAIGDVRAVYDAAMDGHSHPEWPQAYREEAFACAAQAAAETGNWHAVDTWAERGLAVSEAVNAAWATSREGLA